MGDYTVKDTVTSNQNNQSQQDQSNHQAIKDVKNNKEGTVATEQQLPQTGSNDYTPLIAFNISLLVLVVTIAFKLGLMFGRDDD